MRFYETFLKLFTAFYIFTQSGLLAEQIGDLVYSVDQELVTITDYIGPTVDELIVPVTIDGKKVVSIGPNAFADAFIQKLILPDGLERIMESAFDSSYIEQLEIPASVTFIDSTALARVVYPSISVSEENQIYTINDGVLFDKEVTQILTYFRRGYLDYKIPSTVVSFDFAVIKNDSDLETLEIPASVVTISNLEGYTERYLKHIVVDPENTNYTSLDGVLYSKDTSQLILWPVRKSVVGYTFPLEITSIGEEAFLKVNNLGDFSIPESVQMIGARAFMDCRMLTSVTIPSGVTSIEDRTFYGCTELKNVNFPEGLLAIKHRAFGNCGSLDELILPEGFTTIEDFGLSGVGLRSVVSLPSTLQSIGTGGFWGCGFSQISIPESVEFIGEYPFGACLLLSHIYVDPQNGSFLSDEVGVLYDQEVKRLIAFPPENRIGFIKFPIRWRQLKPTPCVAISCMKLYYL